MRKSLDFSAQNCLYLHRLIMRKYPQMSEEAPSEEVPSEEVP
jgi:hypothetical protein